MNNKGEEQRWTWDSDWKYFMKFGSLIDKIINLGNNLKQSINYESFCIIPAACVDTIKNETSNFTFIFI